MSAAARSLGMRQKVWLGESRSLPAETCPSHVFKALGFSNTEDVNTEMRVYRFTIGMVTLIFVTEPLTKFQSVCSKTYEMCLYFQHLVSQNQHIPILT